MIKFHELAHLTSSLLIGFLIWKMYLSSKKIKKSYAVFLAFISALIGGFFIDLDHLVDYYLAFKFNFKLNYFLKGYEFLKTDKIIIPFHSFELAIILIIIGLMIKNRLSKALILAFGLSLFIHLIIDVNVDKLPYRSYFLTYRITHNFDLKYLVTKKHYENHLNQKKLIERR